MMKKKMREQRRKLADFVPPSNLFKKAYEDPHVLSSILRGAARISDTNRRRTHGKCLLPIDGEHFGALVSLAWTTLPIENRPRHFDRFLSFVASAFIQTTKDLNRKEGAGFFLDQEINQIAVTLNALVLKVGGKKVDRRKGKKLTTTEVLEAEKLQEQIDVCLQLSKSVPNHETLLIDLKSASNLITRVAHELGNGFNYYESNISDVRAESRKEICRLLGKETVRMGLTTILNGARTWRSELASSKASGARKIQISQLGQFIRVLQILRKEIVRSITTAESLTVKSKEKTRSFKRLKVANYFIG